jgi:5-methylcytosine-specific restriction endonuclease McrA
MQLKGKPFLAEDRAMSTDLEDAERRELRLKSRAATLEALQHLGGEARREAIAERALADGGFTPRELSARPPEPAAHKFDRLVDHQLAWALTQLRRDGLVENPRRSVWRLAGAALEVPLPAVDQEPEPDRLEQLRSMSYKDYLRTPEWRQARAAAILRAGECCSLDVTHTQGLEVHHRTYERLGEELAADLTVLCQSCHRLHHKEHGRPRRPSTGPPRRRSIPGDGGMATKLVAEASERRRPSLLRRLLGG